MCLAVAPLVPESHEAVGGHQTEYLLLRLVEKVGGDLTIRELTAYELVLGRLQVHLQAPCPSKQFRELLRAGGTVGRWQICPPTSPP